MNEEDNQLPYPVFRAMQEREEEDPLTPQPKPASFAERHPSKLDAILKKKPTPKFEEKEGE
jgi:hypothetical protein